MDNEENKSEKSNIVTPPQDVVKGEYEDVGFIEIPPAKNIPEKDNDDDINFDKQKKQHKMVLEELKHEIIKNIYGYLAFLTNKCMLTVIILVSLLIVYPLSNVKLSFIKSEDFQNFILSYCSQLFDGLKLFGTFIVGCIISDWSSSKMKGD